MKRLIYLFFIMLIVLSFAACDTILGGHHDKGNAENTHATSNIINVWDNCPVMISGSVKTSTIRLDVSSKTSQDIDSIKILVVCSDSNTGKIEYGYCTIDDTLWSYDSVQKTVSGEYYFDDVKAYAVCIYFKDGTKWGDSNATVSEVIENSPAFVIERFKYV